MCEWKRHGDTRIDLCMREEVNELRKKGIKTLACCCGHGRYQKTIVIAVNQQTFPLIPMDMFSGKIIPRTRRFYKRDKDGYYFIPEIERGD